MLILKKKKTFSVTNIRRIGTMLHYNLSSLVGCLLLVIKCKIFPDHQKTMKIEGTNLGVF